MTFSLSASLQPDTIASAFKEHGYVSIRGILDEQNAQHVHAAMRDATPWNLVFNDRGRNIDLSAETLANMPAEKMLELRQAIYNQARDGFQYCYNNYPVYDLYRQGYHREHVLARFYEFLRSEPFLDFARRCTGFDDISFLDAQATRFDAGHFLNTHDDVAEGKRRRCAYVFNFTPEWRPDWGGYLQLLDENGGIRRGLMPTFNTLNVIAIPQPHNVSMVVPYAPRPRFSVTGWMRHGYEE
jgi:Rps23 Pro-64 3,4-dihydroxylase Tpa1-like proline 4-hydroxylase